MKEAKKSEEVVITLTKEELNEIIFEYLKGQMPDLKSAEAKLSNKEILVSCRCKK